MTVPDDLRRRLTAAHQEALHVGDSPQKADQLADRVSALARDFQSAEVTEEVRSRVRTALADAERVLRRDDDGREAARHLQTALRQAEDRPRPSSPFLD